MKQNYFIQKLILLFALVLLLALYLWGHNVAGTPFFTNLRAGMLTLARTGIDVLVVLIVASVSGGIGRAFWYERLGTISPAERVAIESGFGLGVMSIGALLLGLLGVFNAALWIGIVAALLLTLGRTWSWLNDARLVVKSALQARNGWISFVRGVVALLLLLAFLLAIAPPFAWDAMSYHLVAPARYLDAGAITTQADNHFMGFPQAIEVLYGVLMQFGSASTAALLHLYLGVLALSATGGLVARYTDDDSAALSVLLLSSSYSVWLLFGWAYVDLALLLYGALILIAALEWHTSGERHWLILAGALAGMALGVKYTAGSIVIALLVFVALSQPKQLIRNSLIVLVSVAVLFAVWALKGLLLYENPVYPYVFGGVAWDSLRAANFGGSGAGMLTSNLAWQVPILPIAATLFGQEKVSPYAATLNTWLLTLPFALLLARSSLPEKARPLARTATLLAVPLLIFWMGMAAFSGIGAQPRLLLIGAPVAAVLGALAFQGIGRWAKKPLNMRFMLQTVIIITTLLGLMDVLAHFSKTRVLEYIIGEISADTYLANQDAYFPAVRHLATLPDDSTVMLLWEPKSFYCPQQVTCIPDILYDNWAHPLITGMDADSLVAQWQADGVDYLLVYGLNTGYNLGYDFWLENHEFAREANVQFPDILDQYAVEIWSNNVYTLYEWK